MAFLMPASSPSEMSTTSGANERASAQREYMRSSISAQSCDSVPPAPDWSGQEGVMLVVLVTQQELKLQRSQADLQRADLAGNLLQEIGIARVQKLNQADHVVRFDVQLVPQDNFVWTRR